MRSRLVLDGALAKSNVSGLTSLKNKGDLVVWLQDQLEVIQIDDTELLETFLKPNSGLDARDQAVLVNEVVRSYMDEIGNRESQVR